MVSAGSTSHGLRLAENVRVRKESWGLLFYLAASHKVLFVRSGNFLHPRHFDGTWTLPKIFEDICRRTSLPLPKIEGILLPLVEHLEKAGVLSGEIR